MDSMKSEIGIGIDLGGTSIKSALVSRTGEIIARDQLFIDATSDVDGIFNSIFTAVEGMRKTAVKKNLDVKVIGFGTPGSVDVKRGWLIGSTPNFLHWRNVAITENISKRFSLPVYADNDANLMAIGEMAFGAGKDSANLICLTVGTGIGGGIIIDREIYRGANYAGAEMGHMSINYEGHECNCGGKGCLEQYASATAMIRDYKKITADTKQQIDVKYLFDSSQTGNKAALKIIDDSAFYLGMGIASLINIFNPEKVILGGGVAEAGDVYIGKIRETVNKRAMSAANKGVKIIPAQLGNQAGFMGAVYFAFSQWDKNK